MALRPDQSYVLGLQQSAGNAATARLIQNLPGLRDTADMPREVPPVGLPQPRGAWRQALGELSALAGGVGAPMLAADDAATALAAPLRSAADRLGDHWPQLGSGAEVPAATRQPYEQSYGRDLSAARMHEATPASRAVTGALGVEALTVGNHMLFADSPSERVLGHELAHVVQQDNAATPDNRTLQAAAPGSSVEHDADRASHAALAGRAYRPGPAGGEDLAMLAPLVIIAIAALLAGIGVAATAELAGPSYEENRRRAEERHRDPSIGAWMEAGWLWVPVGGTATRIWEAQSPFERYFNVAMMPLDVLTLGAAGSAAIKVANRALWRTALEQAGERELAEVGAGGIRAATTVEVQSGARAALESGQAVVATVGRRNHALVFVKVGGKYFRLTGGISRSMRVAEMGQFAPRNINAYYALGGEATSAAILAEARTLSTGMGLGFSFRSCGLSAARLAETGLLAEGGAGLGLAGGRAFLPVTVMGTLAERGVVTMSQQGAQRIILGTGFNFALMGAVRGSATVVSNMDDFAGSIVSHLVPEAHTATGPAPADPAVTRLMAQTEVSLADIDAALDQAGDGDIDLAAVPDEYLALNALAAPPETNMSQPTTLVPVYSFIAAENDQLAGQAPPPDPDQCVDAATIAQPSDAGRAIELSHRPQYADGAGRLAAELNAAAPADRDHVLATARGYFPFSFPTPEDRDAALLAAERAGISGPDLDRITAVLSVT